MNNLNKYLQPEDAPAAANAGTPAWKFGIQQRIQGRNIRMSRVNVKNFALSSNVASGQGAIGNGTTLFLSSSLTPNTPHLNDLSFAVPYVSLYQGTVASSAFQLYPTVGGSVTPGAYTIQGGLDYQAVTTNTPTTVSTWSGIITDNTAGNQTVLFVTQWRYLQYNSGTVT